MNLQLIYVKATTCRVSQISNTKPRPPVGVEGMRNEPLIAIMTSLGLLAWIALVLFLMGYRL